MVTSRHLASPPPMIIRYAPRRHRLLPVEIVFRSDVLARIDSRELASRQRTDFHILIVCTGGSGTHYVDFEPVELSVGSVLRIHPGQVQQYAADSDIEAHMVLWPPESHHADLEAHPWYPGSTAATFWDLDGGLLAKVLGWIEELQHEQDRFDGSPRNVALMKALLCVLLLRLAIEIPESLPTAPRLPEPYVQFRAKLEERLYERAGITEFARDLGYSSRTLDRACKEVTGQTAKQVLDERMVLELRRLLTHTNRPIAGIATDFGFTDASNFSKFVKRHLGRVPRQVRDDTQ